MFCIFAAKISEMGTFINIGNEGFVSARNGEDVDKSRLIAVVNTTLNTERRFSCVTRSRRFGKSMAAKTLCAYYDHSCDSRARQYGQIFLLHQGGGKSAGRKTIIKTYMPKEYHIFTLFVNPLRGRIWYNYQKQGRAENGRTDCCA